MPDRHRTTGPSRTVIEHPRCERCGEARMMLARIRPGPPGWDIRTFECPGCDDTMTIPVATGSDG